ncbi:hypothetical protein GH714_032771 [Hevea brasiliensis]|uniref:Apple domain-containing protein n=1 Tax=Hevea brasiliensis TaxID=3981 RepID=A0A6A6N6E9_HEVBR|nr:hypothetical protein GH714_032771 [Hevea brasiliensis]
MDVRGQIQQYSWLESAQEWYMFWSHPILQCDVYAVRGTFGSCTMKSQPFCHCLVGFVPKFVDDSNSGVYSGGCVRKTSLQCGNSSLIIGESDKFLASYNMVLPENPETVAVVSSQECESNCMSNCACTAYAYDNNQCSIWIGDLLNLRFADNVTGGITLIVRLAASELSKSNNNKGIVFGGVAGSGVTVLALIDGKMEYFPIRVARLVNKDGDVLSLLDPFLEGNANVEELTRICKVACWCIQDDKTLRPSMSDVVYILEGSLGVNLPPIPRLPEKFSWKPGELSP